MPRWLATIRTSGQARARSASSSSWVWYAIASNEKPRRPSVRTPARNAVLGQEPGPRRVVPHRRRIPRRVVAHAAEPAPAGLLQRLEDRLHGVAERQVGVADDAGDRRAVAAPIRLLGDRRHPLDLSDRPQLDRPVGAVLRVALDEHGAHDVVAGAGVGPQVVQRVRRGGPRASQRWWWASQIGRSGSRTASLMLRTVPV